MFKIFKNEAKVYSGDDVQIYENEDYQNSKAIDIGQLKRIDSEVETGFVSRLGITGRRKRFPHRVKFVATHVVPAKAFTAAWWLKYLKKLFPASSLVESSEIPYFYIAFICLMFYVIYFGVCIFFGYATYIDMRTSPYLSMAQAQTIPGTPVEVQQCWEVPRTLSGTYFADSNGYWSTRSLYDPAKTLYGITMSVLKITSEQFAEAMLAALKKMTVIAERSASRDLAWNIIMFASYYATVYGPITVDGDNNIIPGGTLTFYAAADADILLGKRSIISATFANQYHGICDPAAITSYFDNGDKSFVFQFQLCSRGFCQPDFRNDDFKYQYIKSCKNWYANVNTSLGTNDGSTYTPTNTSNPSVSLNNGVFLNNKIFDPQQFGYTYGKLKQNYAEVRVDSRSLTLALAVNYGMLQVKDLTKMTKSEKLKSYLTNLARQQVITIAEANKIYPFYDHKYAPMEPIYCMLFEGTGSGPADVSMPNFNGNFGDDDASFRALYDDDLSDRDDASTHIQFGGPNLNIFALPKKVFVAFQIVVKNYDITTVSSIACPSTEIDLDKSKWNLAIKDTLTAALNDYTGPQGGLVGAIDKQTFEVWYFNADPTKYSGKKGFDPSRFTRRLEDQPESNNNAQERRRLQGPGPPPPPAAPSPTVQEHRRLNPQPPGPPPPPAAPSPTRAPTYGPGSPTPAPTSLPNKVTTANTLITFGFSFNPDVSKKADLYSALQDLTTLLETSNFISNLNTKIQSTVNFNSTGKSFRLNLMCNAGLSQNLAVDPYSLSLGEFFVKRRPNEGQDDDTLEHTDDDYFKDDAIPDEPTRRLWNSADEIDEPDERRRKTRDRIFQILKESNEDIFSRRLEPVTPPIPKITKNTGAACFIQVDDTFMYPIMSHSGQAGTTRCDCKENTGNSTKPNWNKDIHCLASTMFDLSNDPNYKDCKSPPPPPPSPGPGFIDSKASFPFLPKICDKKDGHKTACKHFDINVGLLFYPGKVDPRDKKLKPNGQIFAFGQSIYNKIISSPTDGDLKMIESGYDAMGMIAGAANDYQDLLPKGVPGESTCVDFSQGTVHNTTCYGRRYIKKYSAERWNKAFQQLCGATGCSMLNFRLRDKLTLPPMNIFDYRPDESPSYTNILVKEEVVLKLKNHVPTSFVEVFYQCISSVENAWISAIGVGNSNANLFASVAFTLLILLLLIRIQHMRSQSKKSYMSPDQIKEEEDASRLYRDQMMIDAIELLVEKEKERCGETDPRFNQMEQALDGIYKIDDKEYDVQWEYIDEKLEVAD